MRQAELLMFAMEMGVADRVARVDWDEKAQGGIVISTAGPALLNICIDTDTGEWDFARVYFGAGFKSAGRRWLIATHRYKGFKARNKRHAEMK